MKHLNDNLLCVVTTFLTGPDHQRDDILQICITPLDRFLKVDGSIAPFIATMNPRRGNCDKDWLGNDFSKMEQLIRNGIDPDFVQDQLEKWFVKYRIRETKLIMPLAYNWALSRSFLIDWLSIDSFNGYFDYRYRDIMTASIYCNDRAYWHEEDYPYPKHNLTYICNQCGVDYKKSNDIMQQSMAIAACYRQMMGVFIGV
ncbi:MAG TPA: hypothetical protein PLE74_01130 [Candidatus Cloacimonadota bacterium]|nr:hypothetical protein [Candidatus Cloacimonadota bacterium]